MRIQIHFTAKVCRLLCEIRIKNAESLFLAHMVNENDQNQLSGNLAVDDSASSHVQTVSGS